ncbi:MAG: hypothetical protein H6865_06415 [Rhodospirillales bacterium]|nr:hypothetical protein [Alphaproteobacteria bacterium]MCB9987255.1 hypothetical protein [Rhodospirillales bacterium]USO07884.1 MAG: hypothetical protein H6866_01285 [Rhodospirillales bacterium]
MLDIAAPPLPDETPRTIAEREAERVAMDYIRAASARLLQRHGLIVKTGIELEFYPVAKNGSPSSYVLDVDDAAVDMHAVGLTCVLKHEYTTVFNGQFEFATGVAAPLQTVHAVNRARRWLESRMQAYGISRLDFSARPFTDRNPSSLQVSFSLWSRDNKPLFRRGMDDTMPEVASLAVSGVLDAQIASFPAYAPADADYERFDASMWVPRHFGFNYYGNSGASLMQADAYQSPHQGADTLRSKYFRVENRLASASANPAVIMATTLAGIEWAQHDAFPVYDAARGIKDRGRVPRMRSAAVQAFNAAATGINPLQQVAPMLHRAITAAYTP